MPSEQTIRVLNPPPGGRAECGRRHAERYVRQKRADWCGDDAIMFRDHHIDATVRQRALYCADSMRISADVLSELRRVPVIRPELLIVRRRAA